MGGVRHPGSRWAQPGSWGDPSSQRRHNWELGRHPTSGVTGQETQED